MAPERVRLEGFDLPIAEWRGRSCGIGRGHACRTVAPVGRIIRLFRLVFVWFLLLAGGSARGAGAGRAAGAGRSRPWWRRGGSWGLRSRRRGWRQVAPRAAAGLRAGRRPEALDAAAGGPLEALAAPPRASAVAAGALQQGVRRAQEHARSGALPAVLLAATHPDEHRAPQPPGGLAPAGWVLGWSPAGHRAR